MIVSWEWRYKYEMYLQLCDPKWIEHLPDFSWRSLW